jgi:hypothetical protein
MAGHRIGFPTSKEAALHSEADSYNPDVSILPIQIVAVETVPEEHYSSDLKPSELPADHDIST